MAERGSIANWKITAVLCLYIVTLAIAAASKTNVVVHNGDVYAVWLSVGCYLCSTMLFSAGVYFIIGRINSGVYYAMFILALLAIITC